jgi:hypothetical protein
MRYGLKDLFISCWLAGLGVLCLVRNIDHVDGYRMTLGATFPVGLFVGAAFGTLFHRPFRGAILGLLIWTISLLLFAVIVSSI